MNLNVSEWKPFKIGSLFYVLRGHDLELVNCEESYDDDSIAFVSRSAFNNGITARIQRKEGLEPLAAGLISVAGSGSSTLSTFVQPEPFYTGFHMFALKSKEIMSFEAKMFVTRIIEANKYKYCYGRQADKTIPLLEINLPIRYDNNNVILDSECKFSDDGFVPDWQFMEDYIKSLHYKPLTTSYEKKEMQQFDFPNWKEFYITRLFDIERGSITSLNNLEKGNVPIISASGENEGISYYANVEAPYSNNITIAMNGATGFTSYHSYPFNINVDCCVLKQKFNLNKYNALFIVTIINQLKCKYSYGRKMSAERIEKEKIKLPIKHDYLGPILDKTLKFSDKGYIPDWDFMENYIKSLPYGDRI